MDDSRTQKSDSASGSIEICSGSGNDRGEATDSAVATLALAPLKSIQPYRTQDEFLVAMKEDLAEWLNTIYDIDMDENSLFAHLANGVLLCRHANSFNAAATDSGTVGSRRNSGYTFSTSGVNPSTFGPSSSTSGACPSISSASSFASVAPFSAVIYRESAQPGTFQSRDNIANFLRWCRYSLGLRDTLLFETEDLVQGRNERNVVLCLLEVARRGARIGMPAPSLVRLEAEIDAEIARDEAASRLLGSEEESEPDGLRGKCATRRQEHDDVHGSDACMHHHGNAAAASDGKTKDAQVQTTDEDLTEAASSPPHNCRPSPFLLMRSSFDSVSSCSDSSSVRGGYSHHPPAQTRTASAAAAVGRQRRPVIEVDMMSLDEMVRNILNKCTCEFQYPMVRVSEGKYKIGDSLTLIFVRILRNHVMVRIGGGWDTLENYLNRHDPCRMETRVTKSGSSHLRSCTQACGGVGAAGVGAVGVGRTGVGRKDGTVSCDTFHEAKNERSFVDNLIPETSEEHTENNVLSRPDDPVIREVANLISQVDDLTSDAVSNYQSSKTETQECAGGEADHSTGPTLSDKRTVDVACQTDEPNRRYSSSSGASSWESASRDDRCIPVELTGCSDVTLDVTATPDVDNSYPSRIEDSKGSLTDPLCKQPNCSLEKDSGKSGGRGSTGQPAPSGLGCPQCGQSAAAGKQTAGLCRLCRQRRGQLRPASAKVTRQLPLCPSPAQVPAQPTSCSGPAQERRVLAQRPASAQHRQERLIYLESDSQFGPSRAVPAAQRPTSAQSQWQWNTSSASAQKQRRRTLGPALIQDKLNRTLGPTSTPGELNRIVGYALGQEQLVKEQHRNSLGPTSTPGQLHRTLGPALAQDTLSQEQQRPRQRTQRPASAQEHRRFAKRSREDEELKPESNPESARRGENTLARFSPAVFSHKPSPLTSTPKTAPKKTKSQDDLLTKEGTATNRKSPGETPFSRKTISSHADRQHIRELFKIKKLDAGCSYDIPELAEHSSEDLLPPNPAQISTESQTRPRKDVGRSKSFSKIPKPFAMN